MSTLISHPKQSLHAQLAHVNEKIVALEAKLRALDVELASLYSKRSQYQLVEELCTSLDKLNRMGAASLFWEATEHDPEKQLQLLRGAVTAFQQNISAIEHSRAALLAEISDEQATILLLNNHLAELQEIADNLKNESELERQARAIPNRATAMPWSVHGEDERRFRRILFAFLFVAIVFGGLIPILRPPVEKNMGMVVPERIARIIKKKQEVKPEEQKPPEKEADKKEKKEEKLAKKAPADDLPKPPFTEAQKARSSAETKGVLAFKSNFSELMEDAVPLKIGAAARITNKADLSGSGSAQRSIIVSQVTGGSGGINTATINRKSEGSGSQRIAGPVVNFTRVESAASTAVAETERLLSKGGKPTRTDEEIQIVFDRYKAALYRIYNRELRVNPTLRGRMVLRIVIEPDGQVSSCTVKSTDLASPALSADIVNRVLSFNFGTKEGVSAVTILYPIDFLPAS